MSDKVVSNIDDPKYANLPHMEKVTMQLDTPKPKSQVTNADVIANVKKNQPETSKVVEDKNKLTVEKAIENVKASDDKKEEAAVKDSTVKT